MQEGRTTINLNLNLNSSSAEPPYDVTRISLEYKCWCWHFIHFFLTRPEGLHIYRAIFYLHKGTWKMVHGILVYSPIWTSVLSGHGSGDQLPFVPASTGNQTQANCMDGIYLDHWTTLSSLWTYINIYRLDSVQTLSPSHHLIVTYFTYFLWGAFSNYEMVLANIGINIFGPHLVDQQCLDLSGFPGGGLVKRFNTLTSCCATCWPWYLCLSKHLPLCCIFSLYICNFVSSFGIT